MSVFAHALPPSKVRENITRCLKAGLVPSITSSPGLGKSEIVQSIADDYNLELRDFRLGQADITDLNGLPRFTENGRATWAPFDIFPVEEDTLPEGKDGWLLFFDEITSASKQLQAAAYKILLERKVGNHNLHKRVMMVCAGNLETDNAVVHGMSTALQSRLIHFQMRVDHSEWMNWAINKGIDHRIIGFLEFRPELLHSFDPEHQDKTFACPRTWKFCSDLILGNPVVDSDVAMIAGTVSSGVALEFVQFARLYTELPKMADILNAPETAPVPVEASTRYAMSTSLAEKFNTTTVTALAKYLARFPVENRVVTIRMIHRRDPSLIRHKDLLHLFQSVLQYMS